VTSIWRNLCHSVRGLSHRPGLTVAVVLTLALGIGATTAIFTVVYDVLIKPLPYGDADELVSLRLAAPERSDDPPGNRGLHVFHAARRESHVGTRWSVG
jgi:hypothetical protein